MPESRPRIFRKEKKIFVLKRYFYSILILCLLACASALGQQVTSIAGRVVDAQTGETLPFVQIYFIKNGTEGVKPTMVGTTSDMDGEFRLQNAEGYTTILFQMMGYKTEMLTLRNGQRKTNAVVKLEPDVYALQDIVVTPKHRKQKYRRKENPAVELIKEVIAHKDSGNVKEAERYTADTYSRVSFALDNFYPNFEKGIWKHFQFAEKYIDTTGVYPSVTVSFRENLANEYYQRKPHREKRIVQKKRIFGLEDQINSSTFQKNIDAIFKDVDIYDNNMDLLFNRFVSPLSSALAVSYYQYYIMDTLDVDGESCIDLAFVPVNSESYSFTGHLYIVNDSTFKLKRYAINIPPHINLNFVSDFAIEHNYKRTENGLWAPDRTTTYAKFYIVNSSRGILARQTKIYTGWDFDSPIEKDIFSAMTAEEALDDTSAVRLGAKYWNVLRPEPLTRYESSVYDLVQEFLATPRFNSLVQAINAFSTEFVATTDGGHMDESKWDFGPIYNSLSWNMLEGVRLRVGGMTTANLHPNLFFLSYLAFGTSDLRPKYNATLLYSFDKKKYQPYEPLRNNLSFGVQYDVEEPGQLIGVIDRDNLLMSIPLSKPTMKYYQYVFHAKLDYLKEWQNRLTLHTSFDFQHNEAAGTLRYDRILSYDDNNKIDMTETVPFFNSYEGNFELRYSPGSDTPIDRLGRESTFNLEKDAPLIRFNHQIGYLDDRHFGGAGFFYNRTELTAEKRFWLSSFGHIDARLQTGIIWNKVPFMKLFFPQASTSIFLGQNAFNLMQPMEFLMDQYVALYSTYYFKGWILNRIPGINRLKLRGVVSFSGIYGGLSAKNNPYLSTSTNLYRFPETATYDDSGNYLSGYTSAPIGKVPYMELTAGIENIFKFVRIDYVRRLNYNEYMLPDGIHYRKVGAWGRNGVKVSVRFAL